METNPNKATSSGVHKIWEVSYKNWPRLVELLNNSFSVFKQHYTHFHTFFHLHVFQKITNNITQTSLPNGPEYSRMETSKIKHSMLC